MVWVHAVVDVPADQHVAAAGFWTQALGWPLGAPWAGHPELQSFEPPQGAPYLHLQLIDGPPRVHLDLESDSPGATVARVVELGGELVAHHDRWTTLRSPGGFPFCVLRAHEHEPPEPVSWPDGHRSRMVQLCIDSPRAVHDKELAFWRALLTGEWVTTSTGDLTAKWHDGVGSPLQLLFQRLDEPGTRVRAHLDHGTDDLHGELRRLLHLGADEIARGDEWHVLRDPAGLPFCVTKNSPQHMARRDLAL